MILIFAKGLILKGFPDSSIGKESATRETWVQFLGREDPLEKGKATHSNIMAWRIPQTVVHGVSRSHTTERLSKI